jgi:hypothetical protein
MARLDLTDNQTYIASSEKLAAERLKDYKDVREVEAQLADINAYPNLNHTREPQNVFIFDEGTLSKEEIERAEKTVAEGRFFCEHAAGGEATRLKLGPKYLINPARDLTFESMASRIAEERGEDVSVEAVRELCGGTAPGDLLPLSLGERHMLQMVYDLKKLAAALDLDPGGVLSRQRMILITNEQSVKKMVDGFLSARFYGFNPDHVFFMVQHSYRGIDFATGRAAYNPDSPKRLHNHGQLAMQQTMEGEVFRLSPEGEYRRLSRETFGSLLSEMADKISYNIEDITYLSQAIDYESLALALRMGDRGCRMMMEIVANNPIQPQKGGLAAFDPALDRDVMIESFQLKGFKNEDIKFMNKNVNHYPHPHDAWKAVHEKGLNMPIDVKDGYIYFQPVQGDINFLVETRFIRRAEMKPIQGWKSAATTPMAIRAMKAQDGQPGFLELCEQTAVL